MKYLLACYTSVHEIQIGILVSVQFSEAEPMYERFFTLSRPSETGRNSLVTFVMLLKGFSIKYNFIRRVWSTYNQIWGLGFAIRWQDYVKEICMF